MRAYLQVLEMLGHAVVCVNKVAGVWVIPGYNTMHIDFPFIRPPHGNIITLVYVAVVVKLKALPSKFKLTHPQSLQHLQHMKHFFDWIGI